MPLGKYWPTKLRYQNQNRKKCWQFCKMWLLTMFGDYVYVPYNISYFSLYTGFRSCTLSQVKIKPQQSWGYTIMLIQRNFQCHPVSCIPLVCVIQFAQLSVRNLVCEIQCAQFSVRNLVCPIQFVQFSVLNLVFAIQCAQFSVRNLVYAIQCAQGEQCFVGL